MRFKFTRLEIPDVVEVEHDRAGDDRGFFAETFREKEFAEAGIPGPFVQENHSRSARGVLRGLHYQLKPKALGKLVRCLRGAVLDAAVDLRRASPHYGQWVLRELSDSNRRLLWVPPGFAHGFYTLSEVADVAYKQTDYWSPGLERGVRWDDPDLAILWPDKKPSLSPKDAVFPPLGQAETNF